MTVRATTESPFKQIAAKLRAAIDDGHLAPGQQLPTEAELAADHHTTRTTVRRALELLAADGLIDRHQGKRATVREAPMVRIHGDGTDWRRHRQAGRPGFDGTVAEHGLIPRQEVLEIADGLPAPTFVAVALGLDADARMVARFVRQFADEVPVRLVRNWFPALWASGTALADRKRIRGGAAGLIEDVLGRRLADSEVEVEGRNPTAVERELLNLPSGVTVLYVVRTFFDDQGDPVFVQEEIADASRNRYRFRVSL